MGPPIQRLIDRLDPTCVARVEIHDTERLPRLVSKRIALLGDAAHAMTPNIGQGGSQAMEDAWVLARSLDEAVTVQDALQDYERQRADRVPLLANKARERAAVIHGEDFAATIAWYDELASETGEGVISGLAKTVLGGPLQHSSQGQKITNT